MEKFECDNFGDIPDIPFDHGPDEPELHKLRGFDDCERCYFRISTVERITQNVKQLRGEA